MKNIIFFLLAGFIFISCVSTASSENVYEYDETGILEYAKESDYS